MDDSRIEVPILEPDNIGEHMAVDEKYIGGEFYTLLTNGKTGKIALMASTTKTSLLSKSMERFGQKLFDVKILTRDLAQHYDWFGRTNFLNAVQVADKFHVLKQAFETLQDIRIFHRQKMLTEFRLKYEKFKQEKRNNPKLKFDDKEPKLSNGETKGQLLARSRYLLYKNRKDWTESQSHRAELLFKLFPDIEAAYDFICLFRAWYDKDNIIDPSLTNHEKSQALKIKQNTLMSWIQRISKLDIPELNNFKSLIEKNQASILNYFITGKTNAIAESNNSIIQRFINNNRGIKNKDFFYFRVKHFLA